MPSNILLKTKRTLVCFSKSELNDLFKAAKLEEILLAMNSQGLSLGDVESNISLVDPIISKMAFKTAKDRDEHEIFVGLFIFHQFYPLKTEICFEVKNYNAKGGRIHSLKQLNRLREGAKTDVIYKLGNQLREIQVKRYTGEVSLEALLKFIQEKMQHYANDLRDVNLLLMLQTPGAHVSQTMLQNLSTELLKIPFKSVGEILVSFADQGKTLTVVRVYPSMGIAKTPLRNPSDQMEEIRKSH